MDDSTEIVDIPNSFETPTIDSANSLAESIFFMNAPLPNFTSSTRAEIPSAAFLDIIDDEIKDTMIQQTIESAKNQQEGSVNEETEDIEVSLSDESESFCNKMKLEKPIPWKGWKKAKRVPKGKEQTNPLPILKKKKMLHH